MHDSTGYPLPRRRRSRLRGHDYGAGNVYFITICVHERRLLFGRIVDAQFTPTEAGVMVARWWAELETHFPSVVLDEFTVMPNHMHGILGLTDVHGPAPTLGTVIDWYKTMTTNEYFRAARAGRAPRVRKRLWQRNYFDHVIRSDAALDRIRLYVADNPAAWESDPENADRRNAGPRETWQR